MLRRGRSSLSLAGRIGARFFACFFSHHGRLVTRFARNKYQTLYRMPFVLCMCLRAMRLSYFFMASLPVSASYLLFMVFVFFVLLPGIDFCFSSFSFLRFLHSVVLLLCSRWRFVDAAMIFSCPTHHVSDWQPRILLGMVETRRTHKYTQTHTETTLRTRRLLWAGAFIRMSNGRLPKRFVFGNLEERRKNGPIALLLFVVYLTLLIDPLRINQRTERHSGVWHNGGLESDGVGG